MFVISSLGVRILGTVLFLLLLIFSVNPLLLGIRHEGCYFGIAVSVPAILFFALNPIIAGFLQKLWEKDFWHIVLCILMGVLGIGAVLALILSICMTGAVCNQPKAENTLVILGCKVRDGQPSLMLQRRLDSALQYLQAHENVPVIVCGGQGADESITESQCMQEYLTSHGIAENRIYQDTESVSTFENLQNAQKILQKQNWSNEITIVTDGFHQFRAAGIAHSLGLKATAVSAKTPWYLLPSYWVREWLGICYQFLFG